MYLQHTCNVNEYVFLHVNCNCSCSDKNCLFLYDALQQNNVQRFDRWNIAEKTRL